MAPRDAHCCLCGEPRRMTQKPVESFGFNDCISIKEHRPLKDGRWETSPQLLVSVCLWRNGGTARGETHICDGCLVVGLNAAKQFIERALSSLGSTEAA